MDEIKAKVFANSKCKKCHGLGYLRSQTSGQGKTIRKDRDILQTIKYCSCVDKNVIKYS